MELVDDFQRTVWDFYHQHGRHDLPWRVPEPDGDFDPYKILVSEIMLQQTQVPRVLPKFKQFIDQFPNTYALAQANLAEVLALWNGLGYNRRAKFLWQAATMIEEDFTGEFPQDVRELQKLPGVGVNTAGAIAVYSFNRPEIFIETNIRTVFIHHFFKDKNEVADGEILEILRKVLLCEKGKEQPETLALPNPGAVGKTVGLSHYREFYWALMDYGTYLKQTIGNTNKKSVMYRKQSPFAGSKRQLRGAVIRELMNHTCSLKDLAVALPDKRLPLVLDDLVREGLVHKNGNNFGL